MEEGSDEQITKLQEKLNEEYDTFTAKYGLLSSNANKRAFSQDSSYCLLTSLEFLDDKGELKRKADIFTKRTIRRAETVTSVWILPVKHLRFPLVRGQVLTFPIWHSFPEKQKRSLPKNWQG